MALLIMVFRKMVKNRWLVSCLLVGLMISVALISSIPMYTRGVLQRLLIKDLENYQKEKEVFPGGYLVSVYMKDDALKEVIDELHEKGESIFENEKVLDFYRERLVSFKKLDEYIQEKAFRAIGLPVLDKVYNYSLDVRKMACDDHRGGDSKRRFARIQSLSNLEEHIILIDGRLPRKEAVDGVYEALVSESALNKLDMVLGQVFVLTDSQYKELPPIKVKPVGVFTVKDTRDPYWAFFKPKSFNESFLIDESLMKKDFIEKEPTLIQWARWYYAFDYHAVDIKELHHIVEGHWRNVKDLNRIFRGVYINAPAIEIIASYFDKEKQLRTMMWALNVPVIIMLCLYLYMVSQLIIEREKNEIALLTSRGANRFQIVTTYFIQGLILGGLALIAGPWLGLLLCKVLGASNGFMEFVKRKALPVSVEGSVYLYAVLAVGVSFIAMLLPAYFASKTSIVHHKQKMARRTGFALWEKFLLDILLIIVSGYGYYVFRQRQEIIRITGVSAVAVQVDPLLFFVPALFILGIGLLFLRFYPWFIKGIYWAGKKIWPPSIYATLIQVGRSLKSYHFLMVFIIMTISVGLFSATAARTINRNAEEKILYRVGCDIVLEPLWENDAPKGGYGYDQNTKKEDQGFTYKRIQYAEPSFLPYTQLSGVEHAAKVFIKDNVWVEAHGEGSENVRLMAINSYDFGKVAWFRNDLLPYHINEYLNLLAENPSACLISRSLSKAYNIRPGDRVSMSWDGLDGASFIVYGIIDYWPSWNPWKDPNRSEEGEPELMVANLTYVQDHLALEPYQVWLKLKPDATSREVYNSIREKKLPILNLTDARQELVKLKNDPFMLAMNGALTLGFIISGIVCFLGFLLYWILFLSSRVLQFGILRAMGLSVSKLIAMLIWEQFLTSGVAMLIGILIGLISSRLFVPFFQIAFSAASQVPPFRVISYLRDRINIYLISGFTMALGLGILSCLLSRIKIHQAIKLGEE